MRVLYLAPTIQLNSPSGDAIHVRKEVEHLLRIGLDVALAIGDNSEEVVSLGNSNLSILHSGFARSTDFARDLTNYLVSVLRILAHCLVHSRTLNPDIIFERHLLVDIGPFLAKLWKVPVVLEVNGLSYLERSAITGHVGLMKVLVRRMEIASLGSSDVCFCVTPQLTEFIRRNAPGAREVITNPNGVELEDYKPGGYDGASSTSTQSPRIVFTVGNMVSWFDVPSLLKAWRLIHQELFAKLVVVGEGPLKERYRQERDDLGLANSVTFLGAIPHYDFRRLLQGSDVCVAPFIGEAVGLRGASPIKVYEFMASSKPVIVTDVDPIARTIMESGAGLVCEPGNSGQLAEAISRLVANPETCRLMGRNGRIWVEKNATWKIHVERIASKFSKSGLSNHREIKRLRRDAT